MSSNATLLIVSIAPAADWFFVHANARAGEPPVVWRIAAWGITDAGKAIGLIGAFGHQPVERNLVPALASVPPVPGEYLHWDQLSDVARDQARKR